MTSENDAAKPRPSSDADRRARIEALRDRIRRGGYQVPALDVADAILAAHRMVWTKDV